jgi:Na+-transporting NADH:ubiquinone oxidoreductase subunit NqrC
MQWWNDFLDWLTSTEGRLVITTAVVPFVAILVAGIVAALIARASAKRVLDHQDRELKAAAIMAIIGAGRKATSWSSLGGEEKQRMDNQLNEADIRVRLLPVNGASAAADWAAHELAAMKKNSANFSFQAEQTFVDYRNRLLEWQDKPKRARKLFAFDLEQWRFDDEAADKALAEKQAQYAAKQASDKAANAEAASTTPYAAAAIAAPVATASLPVDDETTPPVTNAAYTRPSDQDTDEASTPTSDEGNADTASAESPSYDSASYETASYDTTGNDGEDVSTVATDVYAPPVNAGTVRQRTDPDPTLSEH